MKKHTKILFATLWVSVMSLAPSYARETTDNKKDTLESKTKNSALYLNAESDSKPREISLGLPVNRFSAVPIFEDGMPVSYYIFNLLPSDIDQENFVTSVTAFANFKSKRFLAPGQVAQITPANETRERIGYVRGKVVSVSAYPVTKREAILKLQNASLADEIFPDDASVFQVEIEMDINPRNGDELDWSFLSKEKVDMGVGTFCNIEVITKSRNVFSYMLENVSDVGHSVRLWVKE